MGPWAKKSRWGYLGLFVIVLTLLVFQLFSFFFFFFSRFSGLRRGLHHGHHLALLLLLLSFSLSLFSFSFSFDTIATKAAAIVARATERTMVQHGVVAAHLAKIKVRCATETSAHGVVVAHWVDGVHGVHEISMEFMNAEVVTVIIH